jgi:PTH1 family peptidyl-tRNA hydrolase
MKKFLIAGLGNAGGEYAHTRHNIGFDVVDRLAAALQKEDPPLPASQLFRIDKLAYVCESRYRGKHILLIKPTTYMNLSGKALNYWMQAGGVDRANVLVVTDDLALPFGALRMKKKGGAGGHNGLTHIIETLQTEDFARLRFGIGSDFPRGKQVDYVLSRWSPEEESLLNDRLDLAVRMIKSYLAAGVERAMTDFNNK